MSRYSIPSKTNPALTIHYGYDYSIDEYFVNIITSEIDKSNPGRTADLILMVGTKNVFCPDPNNPEKLEYSTQDLLELISNYGGNLPNDHEIGFVNVVNNYN